MVFVDKLQHLLHICIQYTIIIINNILVVILQTKITLKTKKIFDL